MIALGIARSLTVALLPGSRHCQQSATAAGTTSDHAGQQRDRQGARDILGAAGLHPPARNGRSRVGTGGGNSELDFRA
jgi:hypothetical protein